MLMKELFEVIHTRLSDFHTSSTSDLLNEHDAQPVKDIVFNIVLIISAAYLNISFI